MKNLRFPAYRYILAWSSYIIYIRDLQRQSTCFTFLYPSIKELLKHDKTFTPKESQENVFNENNLDIIKVVSYAHIMT